MEKAGYIIEQYPQSLHRRRAAYMDRLAREFPYHSRRQLVRIMMVCSGNQEWHLLVV